MAQQGAAPGATLGPPLAKSKTVTGHPDGVVMVLLHGLAGRVNGKNYEVQMVPMCSNTDEWIAAVASYVRNNFGNRGGFVTPEDVKRLRKTYENRAEPWTEAALHQTLPEKLPYSKQWKLTASTGSDHCDAAVDGKSDTRWDTGTSQVPGQWFQIELPKEQTVAGLRLDTTGSAEDYPRGYRIETSLDGTHWEPAVKEGKGIGAINEITFPPSHSRFIRIVQTLSLIHI